MDRKHVQIKKPPGSGSWYYNYKGMYLLATVNANYEILLAEHGRISDGGVIRNTKVYELLNKNALKIPLPSQLPNGDKTASYVFVGDEAFQ
jgi:hypothetical protein